MKVLFIGGTGIISTACAELALTKGIDVTLLNRGQSVRTPPPGAKIVHADMRDPQSVRSALAGQTFDAVADFIAYTPAEVRRDLDIFGGQTGQYVFISSASAYQTPAANLPIRESTPLDNPLWKYSQDKIACEELLLKEYRKNKFPFTVVRPSHTYDPYYVPVEGGYTVLDRMLHHKPVIVPGDGTSIWTLTRSTDFAKGFVGLLGNARAIGETFHLTSDEWLTWNQIYWILGKAAGVEPEIVHVPTDLICAYDPGLTGTLLSDKSNSAIFDNSKIKQVAPEFSCSVPFSRGAEEIIACHRANPVLQKVDRPSTT
jgi:nucleoside-diphosphate-sugar epimerase